MCCFIMDDKSLVDTTTVSIFALGGMLGFTLGYYYWKYQAEGQKPIDDEPAVETVTNGKVYRMIIGVRNDLKMGKGKVAAQVAHAAVAAYIKASSKAPKALNRWTRYGQAKITVRLDSEEEMLELATEAKEAGILVSIIRDAGHTQVEPDTRTVVAFGPAPKDELDKVTGHLKLY